MPQPYAGKVASLRQLIAWLTAEIGMLDQVAAELLSGHEGYQAVQALPGIGRPAPTAAPGGAARGSAARRRVSVAARCHQFAAGTLAGDLADPDVCVHLWPGMGPGAVEAFGDGLAAGLAEVAVDVELCAAVEAAVEEVEALAMLSPSAKVAPSTAPPAAVPMSGLVILTRFSFAGARRAATGRGRDPCAAAIGWDGPGDPVLRRAVARGGPGGPPVLSTPNRPDRVLRAASQPALNSFAGLNPFPSPRRTSSRPGRPSPARARSAAGATAGPARMGGWPSST